MSIAKAVQHGVFFCSDSDSFSYAAFCLADGLDQMGIPVYSNISGSHFSTSFAFDACPDPLLLKNCYCAVLGVEGACDLYPNIVKQISPVHERTVALCMNDDIANFCIEGGVPLFCTHENSFRRINGIRIPIGFDVSTSMIDNCRTVPSFELRKKYVLDCFKPSLRQDVRACLDLILIPNLQQIIPVEKRYSSDQNDYWEILKSTSFTLGYVACSC